MADFDSPIKLRSARAWRTYIGGSQIDAIHGLPNVGDTQFPEDWIISTVSARNAGREDFPNEGQCFVDGSEQSLKELVERCPVEMLGREQAEKLGSTTGVLVKLIDAGERLTIQAHPSKEKAQLLFGSPFGKTECWHIVGGRSINGEEPCIYMGFRPGVTREMWKDIFERQDIPAMLGCLHRFDVKSGETYLIRGGGPHAIGAGCLLVEIQEPTDYTVRTERITPAGLEIAESMLHQGLGFEKMFDTFEYDGVSKDEAYKAWCIAPRPVESADGYAAYELVGYGDTECFRLMRYDIERSCHIESDGHFCGLYFLGGEGNLRSASGTVSVKGGDQFFVPASSEAFDITSTGSGKLTVFRCFGPKL